ncbi:MAG TPA: tetratricopeptide repeat protein [Vicinamibacterales bacterium]|nr:tetratricopeptide repeat protein [Vicinamibacterales bacterium]
MSDNSRLESLRRRVQQDPSSIAFAQLAEEYRRVGQLQEAVNTSRAGLEIHPAYHSARVTLGRALLELNLFEDAARELAQVLKSAPENLAAIKSLAEAHHRQGALVDALAQYRAALAISRRDPDLEQTVRMLERTVEVEAPAAAVSAQAQTAGDAQAEVSSAPLAAVPSQADEANQRGKARALATVAVLEQWLHAVHVARAQRCA